MEEAGDLLQPTVWVWGCPLCSHVSGGIPGGQLAVSRPPHNCAHPSSYKQKAQPCPKESHPKSCHLAHPALGSGSLDPEHFFSFPKVWMSLLIVQRSRHMIQALPITAALPLPRLLPSCLHTIYSGDIESGKKITRTSSTQKREEGETRAGP